MKINYVMFDTKLTGGVRVLLEIANKLVERGHEVTITSFGDKKDHSWYPLKAETNYRKKSFIKKIIKYGIKEYLDIHTYPYQEIFELTKAIPDCDINVATHCFTAFSIFESEKGMPFYHMQHYEPLLFDDLFLKKLAEETYFLPINKISNSIWLKNKIREKYGYDTPIVNPAINLDVFYPREVDKDIDKLNSPKRPIPSNRISASSAAILSSVLFLSGILLNIYINRISAIIATIGVFFSIIYPTALDESGSLLYSHKIRER